MTDVVDAVTRSRMMSGIRSKNTKPEIAVRKGLHAAGFRYRLHPKEIPGKPDLYLPQYKAAVFVHGCFWHGHDCSLFRPPRTRPEFWQAKIDVNRTRDAVVDARLEAMGLRRLAIWECAFRGTEQLGLEATLTAAAKWISGDEERGEIRGKGLAPS